MHLMNSHVHKAQLVTVPGQVCLLARHLYLQSQSIHSLSVVSFLLTVCTNLEADVYCMYSHPQTIEIEIGDCCVRHMYCLIDADFLAPTFTYMFVEKFLV